jgi:hypothetical protein
MVRINLLDSGDVAPNNGMRWLALLQLIMEIEHFLELISREYEYVIRPFWSLRIHIVDAVGPLGHEAKIMASTPDGPKEVWVRVF